jgi:hypothetical protein
MTELVANYGEWFGLRYAITYFYNVYGPRERADALGTVVAIFASQHRRGLPISVVAPGTQERIFTHVADIVEGLVHVGEKGVGDGYGIGGDDRLSILDLARLFGARVIMLPERAGNRMTASIDSSKTRSLGWTPAHSLKEYIESIAIEKTGQTLDQRILVFTTTFHPVSGPAEDALLALARSMPDVQFDIVTAAHTRDALSAPDIASNIHVHRIGSGSRFDKFFLPFLGKKKALELAGKHRYLFAWSIMASYGTLPALAVRRGKLVPLLITLADQSLSWYERLFLRIVLSQTDQVYASTPEQGKKLISLEARMRARRTLGEGDAFANQVRFAYSQILDSWDDAHT